MTQCNTISKPDIMPRGLQFFFEGWANMPQLAVMPPPSSTIQTSEFFWALYQYTCIWLRKNVAQSNLEFIKCESVI